MLAPTPSILFSIFVESSGQMLHKSNETFETISLLLGGAIFSCLTHLLSLDLSLHLFYTISKELLQALTTQKNQLFY